MRPLLSFNGRGGNEAATTGASTLAKNLMPSKDVEDDGKKLADRRSKKFREKIGGGR